MRLLTLQEKLRVFLNLLPPFLKEAHLTEPWIRCLLLRRHKKSTLDLSVWAPRHHKTYINRGLKILITVPTSTCANWSSSSHWLCRWPVQRQLTCRWTSCMVLTVMDTPLMGLEAQSATPSSHQTWSGQVESIWTQRRTGPLDSQVEDWEGGHRTLVLL